ncbi:f72fed9a-3a0b-406b-bd68-b7f272b1a9a9 [Sclerotinia trifoliorum]|uniref:F72fed9a-3a0b-406b-bd68-b7f272b1a9a9 n=1 Tax=Sclerotinia trifoliorum TaxID=28548 RepID=A0A8H2ZRU0_9HELO|nr:f72fed9a-3a0b-406b-bd68-b7f272b1a9a9 [Sclerotinia trifoliorum]
MAFRISRQQVEETTSAHGQLSSHHCTKLPTSPNNATLSTTPRTIKQETSHRSAPRTSKGAKEYRLSSNPQYQIDTNQDLRAPYHNNTHHPSDYAYQGPDTRDTTPSIDGMSGLLRIGLDSKVLIDALSQLGNYDVAHIVDLPMIALIGDQSAGKSSLISLLSGMSLPRDSGCCTRCPANIITKAAETWSCTISLRQKYGYRTSKTKPKDRDVTKNNPFPPWFEQELVMKEFIKITDKGKLEEAMKWAQIALLNHNQDYEQFIPEIGARFVSNNTDTEADATPNVVKVEISGPGLPTLSFFDLPGIVANTPTIDQRYLIKFFENIAKKYIQAPNTLIIFVMTMSVEAVLSKAKALIEEERATNRCMGVLTKPDTLVEKDGTKDWEKILNGEEHRLGHGWRVTKQPGPDFQATGKDFHLQACEEEEEFFSTNELWKHSWSKYKDKCGIPKIQKSLSRLLAESIRNSLPDIKMKVHKRKATITQELQGLPEVPKENVQLHLTRLLRNFSQDVENMMNSEQNLSDTTFYGSWTKLSRQFHELILHNKPKFILADKSDRLMVEVIDLDNDDGETKQEPVPEICKKRGHNQMVNEDRSNSGDQTPSTPLGVKSETPIPHTPRPIANYRQNPFRNTIFERHANYGSGFASIADIRSQIENHTYMGLPDMVNTPVYKHFCQKAVRDWKPPVQQLLHGVIGLLRSKIEKSADRILGPFRQTDLYKQSMAILREWIEEISKAQRDALDELYELEIYSPFTTNQEEIQKTKQSQKLDLQKARHKVRAARFIDKEIYIKSIKLKTKETDGEKACLAEKRKLIELVKPDQLGKDSFQNEIDVAAYIRAYYIVAGKRFIDSTCISINNRLFRRVKDNITDLLETRLGVNHPQNGLNRCVELMEENSEIGVKRRKLQNELKELEAFEIKFEQLIKDRVGDDEDSSTTPAFEEENHRSESEDPDQLGYRQQSPVSEFLKRRRGMYSCDNEISEAENGDGSLADLEA